MKEVRSPLGEFLYYTFLNNLPVPVLAEPPKKRIEVAQKSCQKQTGVGGEARESTLIAFSGRLNPETVAGLKDNPTDSRGGQNNFPVPPSSAG